jgi:hypothetical protein
LEQYCETIPSAAGDTTGGSGPGPQQPIGNDTLSQIQAQAGREAVRAITGSPAPITSGARKPPERSDEPGPDRGSEGPARTGGVNPLSAVASAAGSGAEVGRPLIDVLFAITLLLAGAAWIRFRRNTDG